MLMAAAGVLRRAAGPGARRLNGSAAAAAAAGDRPSGLPKRYSNLDQLEADAQPLLTPQAFGYYAGALIGVTKPVCLLSAACAMLEWAGG